MLPARSPKNAPNVFPAPVVISPIVTAPRTLPFALNAQYTQPLSALSEYTRPPALPTKTRPPTTVGCALASRSPGKPNAHFTFRREACAAVKPAAFAVWNRVLLVLSPQPFQLLPASGLSNAFPLAGTHIADCAGVVDRSRADSV